MFSDQKSSSQMGKSIVIYSIMHVTKTTGFICAPRKPATPFIYQPYVSEKSLQNG